jgi:hypothetical protein
MLSLPTAVYDDDEPAAVVSVQEAKSLKNLKALAWYMMQLFHRM